MTRSSEELQQKDKMIVDLAAGGVAFKERYNMPVTADATEREQPEQYRAYFRERLAGYRALAAGLGRMEYSPPEKK